jgi:hypothetical protein
MTGGFGSRDWPHRLHIFLTQDPKSKRFTLVLADPRYAPLSATPISPPVIFSLSQSGQEGERHTWINSTISTDLSTVYYRYDSTFNTGSFSAISISTIKHCPFPVDGMLDRCNSLSDNDRYLIIDEEVRAVDPPRIASPCSRKPLDLDKIIGSSNRKQQSP